MNYEIQFRSSAWRTFSKLKGEIKGRLADAIWELGEDPRPHGAVKLMGRRDLYRVRVGDYRVIYEVQDRSLVVLIIKLGHRRDVYQGI